MSYRAVFDASALDDYHHYERLDPCHAKDILDGVEQLALNPTALSSPNGYPDPLGQHFTFDGGPGREACEYTVFFRYGVDEETIHVLAIRMIAL